MIPTGNLITLCCPLNSGKCTIQFSIDNQKQSATDDSSYSVHQDIHTSGKLLRRSLCCRHQLIHIDMVVHLSLFVLAKYRVGSAKMADGKKLGERKRHAKSRPICVCLLKIVAIYTLERFLY